MQEQYLSPLITDVSLSFSLVSQKACGCLFSLLARAKVENAHIVYVYGGAAAEW